MYWIMRYVSACWISPCWSTLAPPSCDQNSFKNITGNYRYNSVVRITITDNGAGFDNARKDEIFELFVTLDNRSGPGLGLALVKKIDVLSRGSVIADSGSTKKDNAFNYSAITNNTTSASCLTSSLPVLFRIIYLDHLLGLYHIFSQLTQILSIKINCNII